MGGLHGGTFWALISSLAPGDLRKYSPGDLALRRTILDCCAKGLERLDFSAGDSRYKLNWSDEVVQLHAIVGARTLRGLLFAALFAIRQGVKSAIKGSPVLMSAAITARRLLFGRKPATPTSG
jgi:CelD/BcsL family acetyltransferase involved in cellulose biosynthesis